MGGIGSLDPRGSPHNSLIQQFFQPPWDGGRQCPRRAHPPFAEVMGLTR